MKIIRALLSIVVAVGLVIGGIWVYNRFSSGCNSCVSSITAYAAETSSRVLSDLSKDTSFSAQDYPEDPDDYSLQVIQIAESKDGKLFIYVYQPRDGLTALHVNMCTVYIEDKPSTYNLYALTFIDSAKTIYKYVVSDFTVKNDAVRHYDIASITRKFIAGTDEEPGGDNTVSEKAYPVGQSWTAANSANSVQYTMFKQDVIEVASKYVASVQLSDTQTHNHIIAFSAERNIETLYEVEIIYTKQDITYIVSSSAGLSSGTVTSQGVQIDVTDIIAADHKETVATSDGTKTVYSWDKIQTSAKYCESMNWSSALPSYNVNAEIYKNVIKHDFVIRFLTTSYRDYSDGQARPTYYRDCTRVLDTCILRLKFSENGKVYNIGAVDDVQSGKQPTDKFPSMSSSGCSGNPFAALWQLLKRIWAFIRTWWKIFLPVALVLIVGSVIISVLKWGFKDK